MSTTTHEGSRWAAGRYQEAAAKARAEAISGEAIAAAIEVHRHLGPGLLESAYGTCLGQELALRGIAFRHEVKLPVTYKGVELADAHRLDLLVDDLVVVELKSVERLEPVHQLQLLTYLQRLTVAAFVRRRARRDSVLHVLTTIPTASFFREKRRAAPPKGDGPPATRESPTR